MGFACSHWNDPGWGRPWIRYNLKFSDSAGTASRGHGRFAAGHLPGKRATRGHAPRVCGRTIIPSRSRRAQRAVSSRRATRSRFLPASDAKPFPRLRSDPASRAQRGARAASATRLPVIGAHAPITALRRRSSGRDRCRPSDADAGCNRRHAVDSRSTGCSAPPLQSLHCRSHRERSVKRLPACPCLP